MRKKSDKLRQLWIRGNWPPFELEADHLLDSKPRKRFARATKASDASARGPSASEAKRLGLFFHLSQSAWARQSLEATHYPLETTHYRAIHYQAIPPKSGLSHSALAATDRVQKGLHVSQSSLDNNFLLWIDAVGGFLVCQGDEVMIGQAIPESQIDVPILADVSRRHLKICRVSGGYVAEPFGKVTLNQKEIRERIALSDGDLLGLGNGVNLRFRRPHALSASARLDLESRHRTHPWADAILLMADSCVFGPNARNHVRCSQWSEDMVIFRRSEQLFCRTKQNFEIDGKRTENEGEINLGSHVSGADFSFSLEAI